MSMDLPFPWSLPADLVDALGAEAERYGVDVDVLVDTLVTERLPLVLADAAAGLLDVPPDAPRDARTPGPSAALPKESASR